MVHILADTQNDLLAFKVKGELQRPDYDKTLPILEEMVQKYQKIRIYADMTDVEGITAKALWEEIKADLKYMNNVKKLAVVGDATWEKMLTSGLNIFPGIEGKFFSPAQHEEALQWVKA
jgi:hypothetical protein